MNTESLNGWEALQLDKKEGFDIEYTNNLDQIDGIYEVFGLSSGFVYSYHYVHNEAVSKLNELNKHLEKHED
jgi:hypothetical protein